MKIKGIEYQLIRTSDLKLACWESANVIRMLCSYNQAKRHPEDFVDGALECFAGCVIAAMKILKGFNRDGYNMIWESYKYDFQEVIKTYRESMKKKEES